MKILVIGNGFDLEHGLPTKYKDFLDFMQGINLLRSKISIIASGILYKIQQCISNMY